MHARTTSTASQILIRAVSDVGVCVGIIFRHTKVASYPSDGQYVSEAPSKYERALAAMGQRHIAMGVCYGEGARAEPSVPQVQSPLEARCVGAVRDLKLSSSLASVPSTS